MLVSFSVNLTFLPSINPPPYMEYARVIIEEGVKVVETAGSAAAGDADLELATSKTLTLCKQTSSMYSRVQEGWHLVSQSSLFRDSS